jgi:hypothetical protein
MSCEFDGASIQWLADTVSGGGGADVSIDGTLSAFDVSLASPSGSDGSDRLPRDRADQPAAHHQGGRGQRRHRLDRFAYQLAEPWMVSPAGEHPFSCGSGLCP